MLLYVFRQHGQAGVKHNSYAQPTGPYQEGSTYEIGSCPKIKHEPDSTGKG